MKESGYYSHLTIEQRRIIAEGIRNGSSKSAIAETIGKDKSTVGKEIKLHRQLVRKCPLPLECAAYKHCTHGRNCSTDCPDYIPFHCSRRDRSPGACNGCTRMGSCRFNKYKYDPEDAHHDYRTTLVDSREGVNLTKQEAQNMADIIVPLLKKGHSPYQIVTDHPELGICEKTLYNYIDSDVFHFIGGAINLDLRRKVSRKPTKKKSNEYKKRKDRKHLKGRLYTDYRAYIEENPNAAVTEMDTVYNDESNGPFIQTFRFMRGMVLFALYHDEKTAQEMKEGVDLLERILGREVFRKYVNVLLTDRGSEFSMADAMETDTDNTVRTRVFFCDPLRAGQKGSLENNHIELRYILPKQADLRALGLTSQEDLNLVLSHVNSSSVESLGGKSPLELTQFLYPDLYEKLEAFGIHQIDKDKIILNPELLRK